MDDNLTVQDAVVHFQVKDGLVKAVDHVNARFAAGEITGLIGESGCGKSVLGMAILGLLPAYARTDGAIWLNGQNLLSLDSRQMRKLRGRKLGLIPQNPADSFNPVRKIGGQIREALAVGNQKGQKNEMAARLLVEFGFEPQQAGRVLSSYPFELSGGMNQRAAAAMGTASCPEWMIADEPSKGLDEALRHQLYETLYTVKKRGIKGMLIITHDLQLATGLCDSLAVMYSGEMIEFGKNVLADPKHPYTRGLLLSLPVNGMHPMKGCAPAPGEQIGGCKFASRCPDAEIRCFCERPEGYETEGRIVRCFQYA